MTRKWAAVAIVAAISAGGALGAATTRDGSDSPLDRAQRLVAKSSNFDSGQETGETLVSAALDLVEHGQACSAEHGKTPQCLSFHSAAAWSNIAAVKALTCQASARFRLRADLVAYYRALADLPEDAADTDVPAAPSLPECG